MKIEIEVEKGCDVVVGITHRGKEEYNALQNIRWSLDSVVTGLQEWSTPAPPSKEGCLQPEEKD